MSDDNIRKGAVAHVQVRTDQTGEEHVYKMLQSLAEAYNEHIFLNTYPIQTKEDYNFLCVVKGRDSNYVESFLQKMTDVRGIYDAKIVSYRENPAS